MRKFILILIVIIAILVSYKLYRVYQHQNDLKSALSSLNKEVPNLTLQTVDGKIISLKSLRGKDVVIVFWASWCHFCIEEMPKIKEFYRQIKDNSDIKLISISYDEDLNDTKNTIKSKKINYPVVFDKSIIQNREEYEKIFKVIGVPSIWLIDKSGKIVALNLRKIEEVKKIVK